MSRVNATMFDDMDIPRGRFGKPPRKITNVNFWHVVVDEFTEGIVQCMEARERLGLLCTISTNEGSITSFDIHKDMWCQMVIWSAYRFFAIMDKMFSIETITNFTETDVTETGQWRIFYRTWDVRDALKMKQVGPFLPALFSFHLENWTTMLSIGINKGYDRHNTRNMFMTIQSARNVLSGAIEVARYAVVLALPVCEYRTPLGLPDDSIGNAIKTCCTQMQANRLTETGISKDSGHKINDSSEEELYYRTIHDLIKPNREHCISCNIENSMDIDPTIHHRSSNVITLQGTSTYPFGRRPMSRMDVGGLMYQHPYICRNLHLRPPRSRLMNSKILQTFRQSFNRSNPHAYPI
uniref:Uncharacterized 40.6 kDa protein n=1 Tax=Gallid herpesvirus 2 (strain GA) TaxID=10388 RepID=U1053_GAHVG|nr:RecName: Full=Uncharacterized 40.6 kDa protein [Marek's disease herpesvirus strain GA]pir/D48552/ orf US1053 - infectious laryngotracheitis virus [Gallid alphaherpesvirus 1]AAB59893.1 unknown protein [Gallid alphaherpesvirus 1]